MYPTSRHKLLTLKRLWVVLQISQILYIGSSWSVVREYFSNREFLSDSTNGELSGEDGEEIPDLWPLMCEKNSEIFGLLWFCLTSLLFTISLILVLEYNRTKVALGFFIGVSATMSCWTLIYAVKSGKILIEKRGSTDLSPEKRSVELSAFLGFIICALYATFSVLLYSWVEDIAFLNPAERKAVESYNDEADRSDSKPEVVMIQSDLEEILASTSTSESVVQS